MSATTNRLSGRPRPASGSWHGRLERRDDGRSRGSRRPARRSASASSNVDEPLAAADERVAAEPALLDRLEQEARAPSSRRRRYAPSGVRRSVLRTVAVRLTAKKKTLLSGRRWSGSGCRARRWSGQAQAPAPLVAPGPATGRGSESHRSTEGSKVGAPQASMAQVRWPFQSFSPPAAAPGPSGPRGGPARGLARGRRRRSRRCTPDTLGSSFARVRAGEGAPTLAVVGHIDEIGLAVTNIEENGLLSFTHDRRHRGRDARRASASSSLTRDGPVPGVVGRKRAQPEQARRSGPRLELADLHIDIGAKSREEAARARLASATPACGRGEPVELPNGRFVSKSLDNRLGAYVALESARAGRRGGRARRSTSSPSRRCRRRSGSTGARTAAFALDPDVALAIDVTWATDVPRRRRQRGGKVELGSGAIDRPRPDR